MSGSIRGRIDRDYEDLLREREQQEAAKQLLVCDDVVEFCKETLDFTPTAYQEKFLRDHSRFVVARWARQSGKSHTIAAMILFQALHDGNSRIAILAPSQRQSMKMISRITRFLHKLPDWYVKGKFRKKRLEFTNGSSIEALPNSPDTVRGETLNMVVIDEMCYVANDEELYHAIVYALMTTNGRFIGASTPGSRDSVFYRMCTGQAGYKDVSRHHVGYLEALEPNGPLKKEIVEDIRQQTWWDPSRWQREMEAEFVEDEEAWLPLSLIKPCTAVDFALIPESAVLNERLPPAESYFVGVDLGLKRDSSVVAVVEKRGQELYLVHLKPFKLGTEYGHVLGFLKKLSNGSDAVRRVYVDQTGVGEVFMEEARKSGLKNAKGIMMTLASKQDIMMYLKRTMEESRLFLPYDSEMINEMNVEKYELLKTGKTQFSHPDGTHDDRLWALALAVYASRPEIPTYKPVILFGKSMRPWWEAQKVEPLKPGMPAVVNTPRCVWCWSPKGPDGKCPKGHYR